MFKTTYRIKHTKKKNRSSKKRRRDGKALYKLINNPEYEKNITNLRKRMQVFI